MAQVGIEAIKAGQRVQVVVRQRVPFTREIRERVEHIWICEPVSGELLEVHENKHGRYIAFGFMAEDTAHFCSGGVMHWYLDGPRPFGLQAITEAPR